MPLSLPFPVPLVGSAASLTTKITDPAVNPDRQLVGKMKLCSDAAPAQFTVLRPFKSAAATVGPCSPVAWLLIPDASVQVVIALPLAPVLLSPLSHSLSVASCDGSHKLAFAMLICGLTQTVAEAFPSRTRPRRRPAVRGVNVACSCCLTGVPGGLSQVAGDVGSAAAGVNTDARFSTKLLSDEPDAPMCSSCNRTWVLLSEAEETTSTVTVYATPIAAFSTSSQNASNGMVWKSARALDASLRLYAPTSSRAPPLSVVLRSMTTEPP